MGLANVQLADFEQPVSPAVSSKFGLGLFAPLPGLLRSGGDSRLALRPGSRLDVYGCAAVPQTAVAECASSTASTISNRAYERAEIARQELLQSALSLGLPDAFEERIECLGRELRTLLGLVESNADIVFAPSGTDAALHAHFVASQILGGAFTNVLVGEAETGRGMPLSIAARHFGDRAALGADVERGAAIEGFTPISGHIDVALRDEAGTPLSLAQIDARVVQAVETVAKQGGRVLLHAMDCSKTGLSGPSLACLDFLSQRWPSQLLVLVDACQMRCGPDVLRSYLERNALVLITGSKFFTGPPFSGALLVPPAVSDCLAQAANVPSGLSLYTGRSSWPRAWRGVRAGLPQSMNFGEWLRWEAALEEMRAYFAVPSAFRAAGLQRFAQYISSAITGVAGLEAIATAIPPGRNGEMGVPTILPLLAFRQGVPLGIEDARRVYRKLASSLDEPRYLIGQPTSLNFRGGQFGALRAAASARLISQSWVPGDPAASQRLLDAELETIGAALECVAWHAAHDSGD